MNVVPKRAYTMTLILTELICDDIVGSLRLAAQFEEGVDEPARRRKEVIAALFDAQRPSFKMPEANGE